MTVTPSKLDFSTIGNEITYWLGHIGQFFKGGYSGSGENGVDITLPQDTPVYAFTSGTVKGAGYYGGGGVVSIRQAPGSVWYYQHLDQNLVKTGDTVQAGQLIGYSGGQNSGGNHPSSTRYSSWPHIEVGINAPWGGIWGGGEGPNINPLPYLQQAAPGLLQQSTNNPLNPLTSGIGIPNIGGSLPNITIPGLSGIADFFKTLSGWVNPPTRALKFLVGLALMWTAIIVAFLPDIAAGAASATGNPEVGAAILSSQRGPKGLAGAGIRSAGTLAGRQRTATKQEFRAQRATATVRLKQQTQAQQAQARTMERAQSTARRAATTNKLNAQTTAYNARGTQGTSRTPIATSPERPPSTSRNEYSPRVNSGKAGFGGYGVGEQKTPRTKRTRKTPSFGEEQAQAVKEKKPTGMTWSEFLAQPVGKTVVTQKPISRGRVINFQKLLRRSQTPPKGTS